MTRIISFSWTTLALLAGEKTVTRRAWVTKYAHQFRAGEVLQAYDRSPRLHGLPVANIRLRAAPYRESTADAPGADFEAEGFAYLERIGARMPGAVVDGKRLAPLEPAALWRSWKYADRSDDRSFMWVVRFELVELTDAGRPQLARHLADRAAAAHGLKGERVPTAGAQVGFPLPPTVGELQAEREARLAEQEAIHG